MTRWIEEKLCREYGCSGSEALIDSSLPERAFRIEGLTNNRVRVTGGSVAALIGGVDYWRAARRDRRELALPCERMSPFASRLMMEDFAFDCYQPTGFEFDLATYAWNLAALGFTGMECNRFSSLQPMGKHHWNYAFTNPSLSYFFKTRFHGDWLPEELIEANFRELEQTVKMAVKHGLEPIITSFLPRPYPEEFFQLHPDWRGPEFATAYFRDSGLPPVYALNFDHAEVKEFYRELYSRLLDHLPEVRHLFFWHSDLGAAFGGGGIGVAGRAAEFHRMLRALIDERGLDVEVWLNPWGLAGNSLDELARQLPQEVNFSIKDNPGLHTFLGSASSTLADATVIRGELGRVPEKIMALAEATGRKVCLGQYLDFSEDLDPLVGVPHPVMTFRKFQTLYTVLPAASAAHWGIISPDIRPVNLNQEVIREMSWNDVSCRVFPELFDRIAPRFLDDEGRDKLLDALYRIDHALTLWPQHWGLRLQDIGLRLRYLVRPIGVDFPAEEQKYLTDFQIYPIAYQEPYRAFLDMTPGEALECGKFYQTMIHLLAEAETLLMEAGSKTDEAAWYTGEIGKMVKLLRLFWTTFAHIFEFYGVRDCALFSNPEAKRSRMAALFNAEIANTAETAAFLRASPDSVIRAKQGEWGQCFGSEPWRLFEKKFEKMTTGVLTF